MEEPKFMKEGYAYIGEDEKWHIKDDAPDWAKKEFDEFFKQVDPEPDEDGKIIRYQNNPSKFPLYDLFNG